jgi:hypothetical protein
MAPTNRIATCLPIVALPIFFCSLFTGHVTAAKSNPRYLSRPCQGMTSVMPQMPQDQTGFSR